MANTTDFNVVIDKIEKKQILLPDFQRQFVWKDEEMQEKLVASVLTKMPCGSILLLKSQPDEYASKKIGCKTPIDTKTIDGEIEYLLDGQQRITVVANVFSSVIHDNANVSELVAPAALKRRFFLRIPKWIDTPDDRDEDLFGVKKLHFPYEDPTNDIPTFLSADILKYIEIRAFNANDDKPYNPKNQLDTKLDNYCVGDKEGYLIPLFLFIPTGTSTAKTIIRTRKRKIIEGIAKAIMDEMVNAYASISDMEEQKNFLNGLFSDSDLVEDIFNDQGSIPGTSKSKLETELEIKANDWADQLTKYLDSCISKMELTQIVVSADQRVRAIDIYENLNRGGISLSTFDLIMAICAKSSTENFHTRLANYISRKKTSYPDAVLPDYIAKVLKPELIAQTYNASMRMGCYNESRNEINNKYIDIFLDVLGLYCNNIQLTPGNFKLDYIKRDAILKLSADQINGNAEKVAEAIDQAMYFFQTRCGVRSINEINYSLFAVLVATVFLMNGKFYQKEVHDLLEALYWAVIFSGEYDKDQNVNMIKNLNQVYSVITGSEKATWVSDIEKGVLSMQNFSDKDMILLKKAETEDRYPKTIIRSFVCCYLLSKTYPDMFEDKKTISVFMKDADKLEAHHIIPLGSAKTYGESTKTLREDEKHVCNAAVNFVLITKDANGFIRDKDLESYVKGLRDDAKSVLYLTSYVSNSNIDNKQKALNFLESRFDWLKGDIINRINTNLSYWL